MATGNLEGFWDKVNETTPEALSDMSLEKLHSYYDYFALANQEVGSAPAIRAASERIELLRKAIDRFHGTEQHKETQRIGRKTLRWAIVAGIGTVVLVLLDIPFSKLLPSKASKASQASPASSPRALPSAAPSIAPTATEQPSATPRASATPELAATPE